MINKKLPTKWKGLLIGTIVGFIIGIHPMLSLLCGNVDEGFCLEYFLWPLLLLSKVLSSRPDMNAFSFFILIIITAMVYPVLGAIIGYFIGKLFKYKNYFI